jgi:hypothetical protein
MKPSRFEDLKVLALLDFPTMVRPDDKPYRVADLSKLLKILDYPTG